MVVGTALLFSCGILVLVESRVRENDDFKIREEIVRTIGGCAVCLGESRKHTKSIVRSPGNDLVLRKSSSA